METLVLWEVSRKQDYIFKSNKLKENKGASIIIENIMEKLPCNKKYKYNYEHNLIYNGGGSSLYKFDSNEEAGDFIKKISREILKSYPGIEVFMVTEEYDNKKNKVIDAIDNAYRKLAQKKNRRRTSGMQISFGIERRCESTGLPASYIDFEDGEKKYISREVKVKKDNSGKSSEKFDKLIPRNKSIKEFADLVKGNKRYMAVIHIDGNKMGKKFNQLKNYFVYDNNNYEKVNNEYLDALKSFSDEIKNVYEEAFKHMVEVVEKNKDKLDEDTNINDGKIPIIPIIIAGDDITFVTNGKIGIECARVFIDYLNKKEIKIYKDNTVKLNACAGVAIVRANYPFMKAYELAEDLCSNAKRTIVKDYKDSEKDFSLIDWHLEQGDLMGSIAEIRRENYKSEDNKYLYMRPIYLNNKSKWNNYRNFKEAYSNITDRKIEIKGKEKIIPRSKIKNLREVLKKGENETKIYLELNNISQYFSRFENTQGDHCFYQDKCMYFDAIEIIDLFIALDEKEVK
ncbi:hypothetical protein KQH90_07095 [Anaerosalibacter bizertensis]|uniref:Cas10/Cmr2 second palm domain-containing protein n=1 Tax=Anaerosalibacter bizertensis TaxID=932217 RepID=UPI001C0EF0D7|nr:hypothetical protein [Anaerosalibacter bizertensis]MBU5293798.1 hypothetical protein [Anaerosalibacter bizertensis]